MWVFLIRIKLQTKLILLVLQMLSSNYNNKVDSLFQIPTFTLTMTFCIKSLMMLTPLFSMTLLASKDLSPFPSLGGLIWVEETICPKVISLWVIIPSIWIVSTVAKKKTNTNPMGSTRRNSYFILIVSLSSSNVIIGSWKRRNTIWSK